MRHILFTTLLTASIGTTVFAEEPVSCTISKVCEGPAECNDINAPLFLKMSETSVNLGFDNNRLTLEKVAGELGKGITYAGQDTDNTYTILTVQADGSGFMTGHKRGFRGTLFSAYFDCEGMK